MKKIKFFLLPLLMFGLLFSCIDSDDDIDEPIVCPPQEPRAILKLNINNIGTQWKSTVEGEVVSTVEYKMKDLASLVYVVHSVENDGRMVRIGNIPRTGIKESIQKDGSLALSILSLPFGKYYVTLIGTTDDQLPYNLVEPALNRKYDEAVCQVPNNHIYYSTMQVDCSMDAVTLLPPDYTVEVNASIDLITGEFVFLLPKGDKKIPTNANFDMEILVTDLPSAFYIKTGETLTTKQTKDLGMHKYNNKITITNRFSKQFVVKYPLLANHNLENTPTERGNFKFVYREDLYTSTITKLVEMTMPERKQTEDFFSMGETYMTDLYSSKVPEVIVPR